LTGFIKTKKLLPIAHIGRQNASDSFEIALKFLNDSNRIPLRPCIQLLKHH